MQRNTVERIGLAGDDLAVLHGIWPELLVACENPRQHLYSSPSASALANVLNRAGPLPSFFTDLSTLTRVRKQASEASWPASAPRTGLVQRDPPRRWTPPGSAAHMGRDDAPSELERALPGQASATAHYVFRSGIPEGRLDNTVPRARTRRRP